MQIEYKGAHSITFYDYRNADMTGSSPDIPVYNTWSSWFLIPTTAPYFKPFESKLNVVSIPGSNGVIDLSEAVAGKVLGDRRVGEWEFIMDIERAIKSDTINVNSPWDLYYKIISDIDRKWVVCVLLDAPDHIFTGRITVTGFTVESGYGKIKLSYNVGGRNTAWLSTGETIDEEDVALYLRENISANWPPIDFDPTEDHGGMIREDFTPVITSDQFDIEWTKPDGPMYEIQVDDDGSLIQEVPIDKTASVQEISFGDDDEEYDPTAYYDVRYVNDDGSELQRFSVLTGGEVPAYSGTTPVSAIWTNASFVGWSTDSDEELAVEYVYGDVIKKALFNYSGYIRNIDLINDDGEHFKTITLNYDGSNTEYPIPTSAIQPEAQFVKWVPNFYDDMLCENSYAEYMYQGAVHTVTFYNVNPLLGYNEVVGKTTVPYGFKAIFRGNDPTHYLFPTLATFSGWRVSYPDPGTLDPDDNNDYDNIDYVTHDFNAWAEFDFSNIRIYYTLYRNDGSEATRFTKNYSLINENIFPKNVNDLTSYPRLKTTTTRWRYNSSHSWQDVTTHQDAVAYGKSTSWIEGAPIDSNHRDPTTLANSANSYDRTIDDTYYIIRDPSLPPCAVPYDFDFMYQYKSEKASEEELIHRHYYTKYLRYDTSNMITDDWSTIITKLRNEQALDQYRVGDQKRFASLDGYLPLHLDGEYSPDYVVSSSLDINMELVHRSSKAVWLCWQGYIENCMYPEYLIDGIDMPNGERMYGYPLTALSFLLEGSSHPYINMLPDWQKELFSEYSFYDSLFPEEIKDALVRMEILPRCIFYNSSTGVYRTGTISYSPYIWIPSESFLNSDTYPSVVTFNGTSEYYRLSRRKRLYKWSYSNGSSASEPQFSLVAGGWLMSDVGDSETLNENGKNKFGFCTTNGYYSTMDITAMTDAQEMVSKHLVFGFMIE